MDSSTPPPPSAMAELMVADSRFYGFCVPITNASDAIKAHYEYKKQKYPDAAHVALIWKLETLDGYDEDGEPPESVGPGILLELKNIKNVAVIIVRYFGEQLLGVTCGRLPQCYQAIAKLTLHRYIHGNDEPMEWDITNVTQNVYGLASGDTEVILNVVDDPTNDVFEKVQSELNFDGFRGAKGEVLPRLQNLQADITENETIFPVYRYPGNYSGQEWKTFSWSPTSRTIKQAVETALAEQALTKQTMNHCVTNLYRNEKDFIDHHSDKDLDLNRKGVIVSVSLGDERILELRRRTEPKDVTRIPLPHRSMLVLGPLTNEHFSHSILPKKETPSSSSSCARISLTLRDVRTFLDTKTGRLFGQGIPDSPSLEDIRKQRMVENTVWFGGFCALSAWLVVQSSKHHQKQQSKSKSQASSSFMTEAVTWVGLFATTTLSWRYLTHQRRLCKEEKDARDFFSKKSMSGTKY